MPRPETVSNEDIQRWSVQIDNDTSVSNLLKENPIIREVCYAGLWLGEELEIAGCSEELSIRIRYTAGQLSYGRDMWEVHQDLLYKYINSELDYEKDASEVN